MPGLILLRHAKSSWEDDGLLDHDRPLAPRGRRAAPAMGRWLGGNGPLPDAVLCSTSRRTRETLALFTEAVGSPVPTTFDRRVYHSGRGALLEVLRETDDGPVRTLMLVGHNPGLQELALSLAGEEAPEIRGALGRMAVKFPTAAVAVLDLEVARWSEVEPGCATLVAFMRPKDLPEAEERRF